MSSSRRSTDGGDKKKPAKEELRSAEKKPANKNENKKDSKPEKKDAKQDEKDLLNQESQFPTREVERIIGVTDDNGELEFGIKFKGKDNMELIPARVANLQYPQQIISYYEDRLVWENRDGSMNVVLPNKKSRNA